MLVVRTARELREHLDARLRHEGEGASVGFVPTMGALHDGHLSLVRAARSAHRVVVLSIFVNPLQFDDPQDFAVYTRSESRDLDLARSAGVGIVYAPDAHEIYPEGFATKVSVDTRLTGVLEGAVRGSAHFDGVATVVAKLLISVRPNEAYFGEKDFQQVLVVRRAAWDLGLPTTIVSCPTVREADGLALSSRNVRLSEADRRRAAAIPGALKTVVQAVREGVADAGVLSARASEILERAELDCEYLAFVHPDTLEAVTRVTEPTRCAIAVGLGRVRLIDNELLIPPSHEGSERVE